jgi:serine/threonine-protein kinase
VPRRIASVVSGFDARALGVRPGDVLAGKYRVDRVLGAGGMGIVVAAHHMQLEEKVALKFLLPDALASADAVSRFFREAKAAVKIKSEHVAHVTDIGQLENGAPYIVMEYLEGADLAAWLRERGAMPVVQAVDFVLQACEAIAEAHALGVVHRDLKPANLFCITRPDGQLSIKVLDFGISKIVTPGVQRNDVTSTATIVGTPAYMSPEQLQSSKGVDSRTDIWSLGVILFELLTAQVPFCADSLSEVIIQIAVAPAPLVRSLRRDVPAGLEQLIARCLEKDREHRFLSLSELAIALADFGSRHARVSVERILGTLRPMGISAAPRPLSNAPSAAAAPPAPGEHPSATVTAASTPMLAPNTNATWGRTGSNAPRSASRVIAMGGVAVVLIAAGVGGAMVFKSAAQRAGEKNPATSAPVISTPSAIATASAATQPGTARPIETSTIAEIAASAETGAPPTKSSSAPSSPSPAHIGRQHPSAPASVTAAPAQNRPPAAATATVRPSASEPRPPNCNPPYVIDSAGRRQYKLECL